MHAVPKSTFKAISIQQRHEKLEVLFLPAVRGCGQKQEMPGYGRKQLTQTVTLGITDLPAKVVSTHLMGLVADNQVPVGGFELPLDIFVSAELIETANRQGSLSKPVTGTSRLEIVVRHDLEGKMESPVEFILPLLNEVAGTDDQTTLKISPSNQFFDEKAGHDRLAGTRVISKKKSERLTGYHLPVYGSNLVRKGSTRDVWTANSGSKR